MKVSEHKELIEQALAGRLSPEQQTRFKALLQRDETFKTLWQEELALNRALSSLPDVPLSSNFTALVVQAARRERPSGRSWRFPWAGWSWQQASATAAIVLGLGLLGIQYHQLGKRQQMAEHLRKLSPLASVLPSDQPGPEPVNERIELLKNFDAIRTLAYVPEQNDVDVALLAALEK
jgi:hypothetical protein